MNPSPCSRFITNCLGVGVVLLILYGPGRALEVIEAARDDAKVAAAKDALGTAWAATISLNREVIQLDQEILAMERKRDGAVASQDRFRKYLSSLADATDRGPDESGRSVSKSEAERRISAIQVIIEGIEREVETKRRHHAHLGKLHLARVAECKDMDHQIAVLVWAVSQRRARNDGSAQRAGEAIASAAATLEDR